jgi:hypothetical protein
MAMKTVPTEEEFQNWQVDPVTVAHRELLVLWVEGLKEQWAEGLLRGKSPAEIALDNVEALGKVQVLRQVLDVDYEQLSGALSDEE